MTVSTEKVRAEGVTQWFGYDHSGAPVLNELDLCVQPGEMVIIVGRSGSGKSTLANCIKGVVPHQVESHIEGRILVCGLDTQDHSPAELATRVGMVFQDPESQLCNLYLEDEVAFGPENLMWDPSLVTERVEGMLELMGLGGESFRYKFVHELSGGEKQRLAIASTLAMDPEVIIFDEPTANLDPRGAREVFDAVRQLYEHGYTIIVIEHKFGDLVASADRLVVIEKGRVALDDAPRSILAERGKLLKEEYGLWLPQVAEVATELKDIVEWEPFPLTVAECGEQLLRIIPSDLPAEARPSTKAARPSSRFEDADEIIRAEDLFFKYPNGTVALQGASFTIKRGETIGIAGTNGSGKTTLAKVLVGLLRAKGGSATVCGMDVRRTAVHKITHKVGYVFQYPEHQFVKENVYDEVAYGLEVHGHDEQAIRQKTLDILELFELEQFTKRHPLQLSGGQKRRLSVATALVLEPEVLILDEPTFGQDKENTTNMMKYLLERFVQDRNTTTVLITHDMELLSLYCDRALIMSGGQLVFNGPPVELFQKEDILIEGSLERPVLCDLVDWLNDHGRNVPPFIRVEDFVVWCREVVEARPEPA